MQSLDSLKDEVRKIWVDYGKQIGITFFNSPNCLMPVGVMEDFLLFANEESIRKTIENINNEISILQNLES